MKSCSEFSGFWDFGLFGGVGVWGLWWLQVCAVWVLRGFGGFWGSLRFDVSFRCVLESRSCLGRSG